MTTGRFARQTVKILMAVAMTVCAGISPAQGQAQAVSPAEGFPSKPVRLIVPVPAGGLQDALARAVAQGVARIWGQSIVVENRAGASGIIAAELVAKSAPDGYTLLMTDNVTLMTNQFLRSNLPYDLARDFAPVIALTQTSNILVARPDFPPRTLPELVALARARPAELTYGSFGLGSSPHVDTEAFSALAGIKLTHVPYKGGVAILQGLMSGQLSFSLMGMTAAIPLIKQDRIRPIAYGGLRRSPVFPDVPTLSESGYRGFESSAWFGWLAPAATPAAIIERIAADAGRVISTAEFRDKYALATGHEVLNLPPAATAELLRADREKYAARLKALNFKLE